MMPTNYREGRFAWEVFGIDKRAAAKVEARILKRFAECPEFDVAKLVELINEFSGSEREYAIFRLGMFYGMVNAIHVGADAAYYAMLEKLSLAKVLEEKTLEEVIFGQMAAEEKRFEEWKENEGRTPDIQ